MTKPDLTAYSEACDYPGVLDEQAVEHALSRYLTGLGIERHVVRLRAGWALDEHPALARAVEVVVMSLPARAARAASDASAARDARAARDASDASDARHRLAQWTCWFRSYWYYWDLAYLSATHFGAKTEGVRRWSNPVYDAFLAGCWSLIWTDDTLYWCAKPTVRVERGSFGQRLHCEDGPALANDIENLYFWHGTLVPAYAIVNPEWITLDEINAEPNAEVRRALRERYGEGRYLIDTGAKMLHADIEGARKGSAPRMLLEDCESRRFLVGTDGSTGRTYYMEVDPATKTCQQAHEALCGFPETMILNKS